MTSDAPPLRIHVRDLGPIPEAEVELGTITLFTGENNRGKSWLASLIWGIQQGPRDAWQDVSPETQKQLIDLAREMWAEEPIASTWQELPRELWSPAAQGVRSDTDISWTAWLRCAEDARTQLLQAIARRVFRTTVVGPITIMTPDLRPAGFMRARDGGIGLIGPRMSHFEHGPNFDYTDHDFIGPLVQQLCFEIGRIGESGDGPRRIDALSDALYLPATRTGFVQSLPVLAENIVGSALSGIGGAPLPTFPAPTIQFLRHLVNPNRGQFGRGKLLGHLEQTMLRGTIHRAAAGIQYEYQPAGTALRLPMPLSSAVVTELLPLALILQRPLQPTFLVYEEPEAHLHPELQRKLARLLVRMARRGTQLLITTHSDVFVQEINNCVKVGALRARGDAEASLGPGEEEAWLAPEEVRAYEFGGDAEGKTEVRRLEVREEGVVAPLFNESLADQMRVLMRLDDKLHGVSEE